VAQGVCGTANLGGEAGLFGRDLVETIERGFEDRDAVTHRGHERPHGGEYTPVTGGFGESVVGGGEGADGVARDRAIAHPGGDAGGVVLGAEEGAAGGAVGGEVGAAGVEVVGRPDAGVEVAAGKLGDADVDAGQAAAVAIDAEDADVDFVHVADGGEGHPAPGDAGEAWGFSDAVAAGHERLVVGGGLVAVDGVGEEMAGALDGAHQGDGGLALVAGVAEGGGKLGGAAVEGGGDVLDGGGDGFEGGGAGLVALGVEGAVAGDLVGEGGAGPRGAGPLAGVEATAGRHANRLAGTGRVC